MTLRTRLLWPLHVAVDCYDAYQWRRLTPEQRTREYHHRERSLLMHTPPSSLSPRQMDVLRAVKAQPAMVTDGCCHVPVADTEPTIRELLLLWFVWLPLLVLLIGPFTLGAWVGHLGRVGWRWVRGSANA